MSGEVTQGALRDYLSEHVPGYLVPSAFVTLERLPRTPTGKVDRSALPAVGQEAKRAFTAPETETEQSLEIFRVEVLGVERISVDDSFFELGGHSLLATQVTSRIRPIFHIEISLSAPCSSRRRFVGWRQESIRRARPVTKKSQACWIHWNNYLRTRQGQNLKN